MVPAPGSPRSSHFAKEDPRANLGLHLTLTSEWGRYKWGSVAGGSAVPSLVDELGYFYKDVPSVYAHARLEDVETEVRAQIDRALKAGIDVTHVDSHMGTLQYDHEVSRALYQDRQGLRPPLPDRRPRPDEAPGRRVSDRAGGPPERPPSDRLYLVGPSCPTTPSGSGRIWLKTVPPGEVSEVFIHRGQATAGDGGHQRHLEAMYGRLRGTSAPPPGSRPSRQSGVRPISYRDLRQLQRTGKPPEIR